MGFGIENVPDESVSLLCSRNRDLEAPSGRAGVLNHDMDQLLDGRDIIAHRARISQARGLAFGDKTLRQEQCRYNDE